MPIPKLTIFDLDNTLVATRPAAKIGYKQAIYYIAKQFGLDAKRDKLYNHWKRLVQTLKSESDASKRNFHYSLTQLHLAHKIPTTYLNQGLKIYERELLDHLELIPGVKDVFTSLRSRSISIAVTTGTERGEAVKKLKKVGLYSSIDYLVTSTEIGVMKPDSRYYTHILEKFSLKPSSVLVVGDDREEDLTPAQKIGCSVFLVNPHQRHLGSVLDLLTSDGLDMAVEHHLQ